MSQTSLGINRFRVVDGGTCIENCIRWRTRWRDTVFVISLEAYCNDKFLNLIF